MSAYTTLPPFSPGPSSSSADTSLLKSVELLDSAELGYQLGSSGAFAASGGLMLVAFLVHVAIEQTNVLRGRPADFTKPILILVIGSFMLGSYYVVYEWVVKIVAQYGTIESAQTSVLEASAKDWATVAQGRLTQLGLSNAGTAVSLWTMDLVVWCSFNIAGGVVYGLKLIQRVGLSFVLAMGPLMIALSCFPGPTKRLLSSWVMAIFELSTWGVAATTFSRFVNGSLMNAAGNLSADPNSTVNLSETVVFNLMYAFCFLAIPAMVAMLLHGRGASAQMTSVVAIAAAVQTAAQRAPAAAASVMNAAPGAHLGAASSKSDAGGRDTHPAPGHAPPGQADGASGRDVHPAPGAAPKGPSALPPRDVQPAPAPAPAAPKPPPPPGHEGMDR